MKRCLFALLIAITIALTGCGSQTPATGNNTPEGFQSCDLQNYVIVYGAGNPDYANLANRLADHILERYDVFLNIVQDTDAPSAQYAILLGDTSHSQRQSKIMEYSVTVNGGQFQICAGGSFSAEQAINYLCEQVFTGQEFTLENGEYYQTSFLTTSQELSDNTTVRIMSANVLADAFADSSYEKAHYRAEIFAGMLLSYTPDVLGLQETDENWNSILDAYLTKIENIYGLSYTRHLATYQDKVNYTSLLYRSDKFQVETSDVQVFNWWVDPSFHHNYHMRNISWAQFSSLENPDTRFILANTHWSYRTEHANGSTYLSGSNAPIAVDELRMQCKDETNAFLSSLMQTYPDMPILLTGDFNTSLPFFTESGWTPTSFRVISEEAQANNKAISRVPTSGHFDHIFGAGNYSINLYGFFNDTNDHQLLTDHPFVYADLNF